MESSKLNTDILDSLIVGRVEPHIYAFTTETVPNYLKVGDTYRPVNVRISEWATRYPNLKHIYTRSARLDENTIFRDYSVHTYLKENKSRHQLQPNDIPLLPYYSCEFFKDATTDDIDEAIEDIRQSAQNNEGRYPLYTSDHLPKTFKYIRGKSFEPRKNQAEVIDNFKWAIKHGRKKLLMYAVMRFGKSFTSMCCAKSMDAKLVLVVSAKADVKNEWKKTVESIGNFEGYIFAGKEDLQADPKFLRKNLKEKHKIVLFLTLQDLQGDEIKTNHLEVFNLTWDMLLVDETHFGARAKQYGKILENNQSLSKAQVKAEQKRQLENLDTLDNLDDAIKNLRTNITIHLSGTPYRILMGEEFEKEDIIAFVQFSDIAEAQKAWIEEHKYDDDFNEWENPYFGFPQMIRFAFNPNKASLDKIAELKANGATCSFSELFRPKSLAKTGNEFKMFVHEDAVLDFLKVIDGSKDDVNVLGFLDNERIKSGKLCRHIVIVLPYCASCDALEEMLLTNKETFRNLSEYEIVNISGIGQGKKYSDTESIKSYISACESKGKKTITLTVNRMLTGNTVPEWDTMIFLKQSSSPQEYDQAIFRLQNPYIDEYIDSENEIVKFNMKPQTILVDFDPERIFRLQERKSQIYNVNTDSNGNAKLYDRIEKELSISPIITLDHNKLREVTATNIIDAVRDYASTKSMIDEATDIPIDLSLLENASINSIINNLNPIDSKKGIAVKASQSEDNGEDIDSTSSGKGSNNTSSKNQSTSDDDTSDEKDIIRKKFTTYYALILIFSFLTEDKVSNLQDIISVMESSEDNLRISKNIGLNKNILQLFQDHINGFTLSRLDYKIQNTNSLSHDSNKDPLDRVKIALTKFGRMSESEIVTPLKLAEEMVQLLPDDIYSLGPVLDIASKQGEFTIALMKRYGRTAAAKTYSVCTSKLAYEFTRKVYKLLSLPIEHIFDSFTSYDLIKKDKNNEFIIPQIISDMNFSTIIGNPPYQEVKATEKASSNSAFASAIYPLFIDMAQNVSPLYVSFITPSRWMTKQGQGISDEWVEKMLHKNNILAVHDYPDATQFFPSVEIKGGINYFLMRSDFNGPCHFTSHSVNGTSSSFGKLDEFGAGIVVRDTFAKRIIAKILDVEGISYFKTQSFSSLVSPKHYFDRNEQLNSNWRGYSTKKDKNHQIKYYLNKNLEKCGYAWIKESDIPKGHQTIALHKIYIPMAGGTGNDNQILGIPFYGEPNSVCSYTYLVIGYDKEKHNYSMDQCLSILKYIKSKFFRYMVSIKKKTQNTTRELFQFVPIQDFTANSDIDWSKNVEEIDRQLYTKYHLEDNEIAFIESMIKSM